MMAIRRATAEDFGGIWPILSEVFARGDTYSFAPDTSEQEGFRLWMEAPLATYVAVEDGKIVGTYFMKPNQPGLGAHVANAGYAVSAAARGKGIGRALCEHSLNEARSLGFKALQFNFVVSTNTVAVELWQKCGFTIVGRLPKAFAHKEKGLVDAYVMYRWLG